VEASKALISKEDIRKLLDVEKLKNCFECGICTASCSMAELLGKDYNPRNLLEKILLNPDAVLVSDEPWLCAWCYKCYKRCPQGLKLPEIFLYMRSAAVKNAFTQPLEKALEKIVENIPLPIVTTMVCFHPERAGLEEEKILDMVEHIQAERLKKGKKKKTVKSSGEKVAVIGSGPAGLTVASELVRKGHRVTVFEASSEPGGMLRKCIPEYRLPKQVLTKEIQLIKDLGVEIRTGVKVGEDVAFDSLWKDGYKAVFVGVGANKSQELKIEGSDFEGVIYAVEFLWNANCDEKIEVGKNVVVIGGGNVAMDAARTALRLGAGEVTVLYRRSREEMPAIPWEVKEAEEEGVEIEFLVAPKKFVEKNGKVTAVECVRMQLGEPDESGRRRPIPIEGSEFTRDASMVILAVGEAPDLKFLPREIELNDDGTLWTNPKTMETSVEGVFAGGDAATGPASVIEAIRAGKRAAESMENYMKSLSR
jgi:NADPH-dependent glutamate synthase beta subunit-like oxidoreductase